MTTTDGLCIGPKQTKRTQILFSIHVWTSIVVQHLNIVRYSKIKQRKISDGDNSGTKDFREKSYTKRKIV